MQHYAYDLWLHSFWLLFQKSVIYAYLGNMISEKDPNVDDSPRYWIESNCGPSTVKVAIWGLKEIKK